VIAVCAGGAASIPLIKTQNARRHVDAAILESAPMRDAIMNFRRTKLYWPNAEEAEKFRVDVSSLKRARTIEWDAKKKAVVVTMAGTPFEGKKFAFNGADWQRGPQWACRPLDIDTKYLPKNCR